MEPDDAKKVAAGRCLTDARALPGVSSYGCDEDGGAMILAVPGILDPDVEMLEKKTSLNVGQLDT